MNEQSIRSYLSQVAPVPFHPDFRFGDQIQTFLTERGIRPPIRVELNDNAGPIYHRARNTIPFNPKVTDGLRNIEFIEINDDEERLLPSVGLAITLIWEPFQKTWAWWNSATRWEHPGRG